MSNRIKTTLGNLSAAGRALISGPFGSNIGKRFFKNEGIPVIRGNNLTTDNKKFVDSGFVFLTQEKADELNAYAVEGDLIFTAAGTIGQVGIIPKGSKYARYVISNKQLRFRANIQKVDPNFLYAWLASPWILKAITNRNTGSTVPLINLGIIRSLPILLPEDTSEQQKIAAVLSALDAKIDCNNRINAELEAMAKTLYDYWFVQFEFPDGNGKPYKSSGGRMVYNHTLKREIPAGWESGSFSEWIASDKTGDWGKESLEGNYTLQVNCIRGTDINGVNGVGGLSSPTRFISERNRGKILLPFDFVIEISGGSPTQSTGRMTFILAETLNRFSHPPICSNFCKAIALKDNCYFFNFVYEWKSVYDKKILFGWEGKTSGIKNLLFDAFVRKYLLCTPPRKLAQQFFEFVSPLQIQKQKLLQENDALEILRDWLLPMLMSGQVTVA